jgi:hypothetical protein
MPSHGSSWLFAQFPAPLPGAPPAPLGVLCRRTVRRGCSRSSPRPFGARPAPWASLPSAPSRWLVALGAPPGRSLGDPAPLRCTVGAGDGASPGAPPRNCACAVLPEGSPGGCTVPAGALPTCPLRPAPSSGGGVVNATTGRKRPTNRNPDRVTANAPRHSGPGANHGPPGAPQCTTPPQPNVPGSRGPAGGGGSGVPPQDLCICPPEQVEGGCTHKSEEVLPARPRHQKPSKPRKGRGVPQASPGRCPQRDQQRRRCRRQRRPGGSPEAEGTRGTARTTTAGPADGNGPPGQPGRRQRARGSHGGPRDWRAPGDPMRNRSPQGPAGPHPGGNGSAGAEGWRA